MKDDDGWMDGTKTGASSFLLNPASQPTLHSSCLFQPVMNNIRSVVAAHE